MNPNKSDAEAKRHRLKLAPSSIFKPITVIYLSKKQTWWSYLQIKEQIIVLAELDWRKKQLGKLSKGQISWAWLIVVRDKKVLRDNRFVIVKSSLNISTGCLQKPQLCLWSRLFSLYILSKYRELKIEIELIHAKRVAGWQRFKRGGAAGTEKVEANM